MSSPSQDTGENATLPEPPSTSVDDAALSARNQSLPYLMKPAPATRDQIFRRARVLMSITQAALAHCERIFASGEDGRRFLRSTSQPQEQEEEGMEEEKIEDEEMGDEEQDLHANRTVAGSSPLQSSHVDPNSRLPSSVWVLQRKTLYLKQNGDPDAEIAVIRHMNSVCEYCRLYENEYAASVCYTRFESRCCLTCFTKKQECKFHPLYQFASTISRNCNWCPKVVHAMETS